MYFVENWQIFKLEKVSKTRKYKKKKGPVRGVLSGRKSFCKSNRLQTLQPLVSQANKQHLQPWPPVDNAWSPCKWSSWCIDTRFVSSRENISLHGSFAIHLPRYDSYSALEIRKVIAIVFQSFERKEKQKKEDTQRSPRLLTFQPRTTS